MNKPLLAALLTLTMAAGLQAQSEFAPQAILKPKTSGLFTIPVNLDARSAYERIGSIAGINMVFYGRFKADTPVPLRVEGLSFFEAVNNVSKQTGSFLIPWDSKTLLVAPDSQQDHRDLEPLIFKMFYLNSDATTDLVSSIVNRLRTGLQMRSVFQAYEGRTIIVKDNAARVADAERVISEMTLQGLPIPSSAPMAAPENSTLFLFLEEAGKIRRVVPSTQTPMEKTLAGLSIDMNQPPRAIYEDLAARAGLNVIFDRQMREKPAARFNAEGLDLINALDLLALQTSTFWQPLNESTIHVMDDNQQNRRDRERFVVKVIYLPELATPARLTETLNVLRTSLTLRGVFQSEARKAVVIRDTPLRVFMAEKVVADLMKNIGKPTAVAVTTDTSSVYAENNWMLGNAATARPKLEVKLKNKTTIRLRETPKAAFEKLADLAGLKVAANSSFPDGEAAAETSFNALNVDILDALDMLGWQTRYFWQVVDEHTIRVLPDTQAARRESEPRIQKTIVPADPAEAPGLLNILRTAFGLREIQTDEKNNILVRDTADNVAMVEKLVEILGKGATR